MIVIDPLPLKFKERLRRLPKYAAPFTLITEVNSADACGSIVNDESFTLIPEYPKRAEGRRSEERGVRRNEYKE